MNPTCSVLIPTRGRVAALKETIAGFLMTAQHPERIEVLVRVHEDDEATVAWARAPRDPHVRVVIGDTEDGYGSMDHFAACLAAVSNGDWLWSVPDDVNVKTPGWDQVLAGMLENPRETPLLLRARMGPRNPTIMSRGFYRAIGHMGMTEHADSYVDSLAHFGGVLYSVEIELEDRGLPDVSHRDRVKTWAQYRSAEVAWNFNLDKRKLGAVLGREIREKWTPLEAPPQP